MFRTGNSKIYYLGLEWNLSSVFPIPCDLSLQPFFFFVSALFFVHSAFYQLLANLNIFTSFKVLKVVHRIITKIN